MPVFIKITLFITAAFSSGFILTKKEKPEKPEKTVYITAQDRNDREIAFVEFENTGTKTNHSYLSEDIPRNIAIFLKNYPKIETDPYQIFPEIKNTGYLVKAFTNRFTRPVMTNTFVSNVYLFYASNTNRFHALYKTTITNFITNTAEVRTNLKTNIVTNYYLSKPFTEKNRMYVTDSKAPMWYYQKEVTNIQTATNAVLYLSDIFDQSWTNLMTNQLLAFASNYGPAFIITNKAKNVEVFFTNKHKRYNDPRLFQDWGVFSNYIQTRKAIKKRFEKENAVSIMITNISSNTANLKSEKVTNILEIRSNEYITFFTNQHNFYQPMIIKETENFKRNLKINNHLYHGKYYTFTEVFDKVKSDYIIYGQYKITEDDSIVLSIYLLNSLRRSITLIYKKMTEPDMLFEELNRLPAVVLGALENKSLVKNIHFTSRPSGAYVYVNNVFIGLTPASISRFPAGVYPFEIYYPGGFLEESRLENTLSNDQIILKENQNHITNHFTFKKPSGTGTLKFVVKDDKTPSFYLNSKLAALNAGSFETELTPGSYFIKVLNNSNQKRIFQCDVRKNQLTEVRFKGTHKASRFDRFRTNINHNRNFRLFGIGAMACLGGTIGLKTLESQYYDKRLVARYNGTEDIFYHYNDLWERARLGANIVIGAGGLLGLSSLFSYVFYIRGKNIKIETELNHSDDVDFIIKAEKAF